MCRNMYEVKLIQLQLIFTQVCFCDKGGTLLIISTLVYMDNAIIIILKLD